MNMLMQMVMSVKITFFSFVKNITKRTFNNLTIKNIEY